MSSDIPTNEALVDLTIRAKRGDEDAVEDLLIEAIYGVIAREEVERIREKEKEKRSTANKKSLWPHVFAIARPLLESGKFSLEDRHLVRAISVEMELRGKKISPQGIRNHLNSKLVQSLLTPDRKRTS